MKTFFESKIWPLKNKLYRMAFLWMKDRDTANDIVQEAFSKAWMIRTELEKMNNPTGWMVRTVKNEVFQNLREAKKWTELGSQEDMMDKNIEDEDISPQLEKVFTFLEQLPDKQKEIFHLREVEGLTYEEIATYLEISQDQVKVNLHRARQRLKEYLLSKFIKR